MINDLNAEQAVIGSVLLEGSLFYNLTIEEKHFSDPSHKKIFKAINQIAKKGWDIDVITLVTELGEEITTVGNVSYLTQLADSIPSTESLQYYETAVYEAFRKRKSREVALKYTENPNDESLDHLLKQLENLKDIGIQQEEKTTNDYLMQIAEDMIAPPEESTKGFKTGYTALDNMTGGIQPSDLFIIAGRPSLGKTSFALNIGHRHCENWGSTHIYSLEMSAKQLLERTISAIGGIDQRKWNHMLFSTDDYHNALHAIGIISSWNLAIHEKIISINQIISNIRKSVQDKPNEKHLVIIDYLQLMASKSHYERRDLDVGSMSRELKLLARELNIPIILLSQLSRGVENRQDKRPMLSDLRDSGAIEQDADVVAFLYRDDYYDKKENNQSIMEIILSKQRNGPTGSIELNFIEEHGKFLNL